MTVLAWEEHATPLSGPVPAMALGLREREIPVAEAESLANTAWWELFDDPQLQELVRIALVDRPACPGGWSRRC